MKANLDYVIRSVTAPGETAPSLVPVIVNRIPSRSLSAVISNAIKNNLIAGLQTSAVSGIAAGLADQIYDTLCDGRGVRFGSFFYVRPYLTGQTDANGTLRKRENGIDATIVAGPDFALTLDDFSLHFTGKDTQPKIDTVKYNAAGSDNGFVKKGAKALVYGDLLVVNESDDAKVAFTDAAGGADPVEVTSFDAKGAQQLEFDCPAALVAGGEYVVQVSRSDGDGNMRVSNTKRVKVLGAEPGPTPSLTVTGVHNEETEPPAIYVGRSLLFDGTGLDAWGDGDRIEVKRLGDGETDWESITGTDDVTVTPSDGMLWVSTGWWSAISFGVEDGIQIRFRVTIGGTSAETTGTVHEE